MAPRKPDAPCKDTQTRKMAPKTIAKAAKRAAKASKPGKPIFSRKVMSFSGDFGPRFPHDKMVGWIKHHAGEFEKEVTNECTHLICTIEDFKKTTTQVRKALKLGSHCNIVVVDWIEDCLLNPKRLRAEKGYSLNRVLKRGVQTIKRQQKYRDSFEAGVRAGHELIDNRLNHIYVDHTGFEYKAVCTRINTTGKVKSEKYTIYLFESNAIPHHYMAGAKLSQTGRQPSHWRHECHPKQFADAYQDFIWFFKDKTGIAWEDRVDGLPLDPEKFKYDVPKLGRPVGLLPPGKQLPAEKEDEEIYASDDSGIGLVHDSDSEVSDPYDSENSPLPIRSRSASIETVSSGRSKKFRAFG